MDQIQNIPAMPQPSNKMNALLIYSLIILIIVLIVYIVSRLLNIYGISTYKTEMIHVKTNIGIGTT